MELRIPTLEQLRTVYDRDLRASFPAAELKPLRNIEEMWAAGRYRPWCLFDGDDIAGEAFLWLGHPGWALLDYLCVASDRRNGGLGSVILEKLREAEGDTVIVESLSRLGRSTKDLIELVERLKGKGVQLVSLKEQIDTSTPTGKLLFTLMSALAQFERDVIAERTKEGLKAARARGRKGGRPRCDPHKLRQALKLYEAGQHTVAEIEELTGIKKATLYRARKGMGS